MHLINISHVANKLLLVAIAGEGHGTKRTRLYFTLLASSPSFRDNTLVTRNIFRFHLKKIINVANQATLVGG